MTPLVVTLRALRHAAGLSQVGLAKRARVRQAAISNLETGKVQRVDLGILERLANALGVEPGELLERIPARRRERPRKARRKGPAR